MNKKLSILKWVGVALVALSVSFMLIDVKQVKSLEELVIQIGNAIGVVMAQLILIAGRALIAAFNTVVKAMAQELITKLRHLLLAIGGKKRRFLRMRCKGTCRVCDEQRLQRMIEEMTQSESSSDKMPDRKSKGLLKYPRL